MVARLAPPSSAVTPEEGGTSRKQGALGQNLERDLSRRPLCKACPVKRPATATTVGELKGKMSGLHSRFTLHRMTVSAQDWTTMGNNYISDVLKGSN